MAENRNDDPKNEFLKIIEIKKYPEKPWLKPFLEMRENLRNLIGEFDPLYMVPTTDEEVEISLRNPYKHSPNAQMIGDIVMGLYRVRREKGNSLLDAYAHVLKVMAGEQE